MGLSDPVILYGVHSLSPYNRGTRQPYGMLKVIGSADMALTSSIESLYAGSNKFAVAAEAKTVASELSAKVKAYPGFLFELFLGANVTTNAPDAAGTVAQLLNVKGTSVINATNGLHTVTVTASVGAALLKFGQYVLVATGTETADLYLLSDIDGLRGATPIDYVDDSLKIDSVDITSAYVSASTGLTFTKAGTPAFVTGDTAMFEVQPPSSASSVVVIGASATTFPAFGALALAQKRATGEIFEMDIYNIVAPGLPISLTEQAYSQPDVKMTCLYDSAKDAVMRLRLYKPAS